MGTMTGEAGATAGYHAAHLTADPARTVLWSVIARHLSRWIPADAHVVELGAGYCDWINHVQAARRMAVDIWPDVSQHAAPGVETMVLDLSQDLTALGRSTFDAVLASNLLEHFEPDTASRLVGGIAGMLRPGGRVVLVQPNFRFAFRHYFDDYTHRSIFTDVSLAALLRSHRLDVELVQPRFLPYSIRGARGFVHPWLVRAYLRAPVKPLAGQMLVVARKP